jgi:two-component system sensor histidine kinase/response regulator
MFLPGIFTDLHILVSDLDLNFSTSIVSAIKNLKGVSGIKITVVDSVESTIEKLRDEVWHIIFIDSEYSLPILETKILQKQPNSYLLSPIVVFLFHANKVELPEILSNTTSFSFSRNELDLALIDVIVRTAKENLRQNVFLETILLATNQHAIVAVTDPEGIITHVNDQFCSASEYAREELIGKNHSFLSSRYHPKDFFTDMWEKMNAGQVWHGDIKNLTRSGKPLWLQTTIIPFQNEKGVLNRIVTVRTDITKIKEQHDLAVNNVVQSTNFLANVSHEIRTPIHVIQGIGSMLDERKDQDLVDCLASLKTAATSLKVMVDDILDYTKFEKRQVKLELLPTNLKASAHQIATLFNMTAKGKGIELFVNCSENLPQVMIDPTRLNQILVNLVGNAIKFTDQGSVKVEIECLKYSSNESQLKITVTDTGIGISALSLPHLFQPFMQANVSVCRRFGGTGLGLSISKSLVELMNGSIEVSSIEGVGSTFVVNIPVVHTTEISLQSIRSQLRTDSEYVVIDDDVLCRIVNVAMLKKIGVNAIAFADGLSAIEYMKTRSVQAVFVDNHLPDMTGKDVAKSIRSLGGEFATIPVVALTGDSPDGYDYKSDGFSDWLMKPVSQAQFIDSVQRH